MRLALLLAAAMVVVAGCADGSTPPGATATLAATAVPSSTPAPTATPTATVVPTPSPTVEPTVTPSPTLTPTVTATPFLEFDPGPVILPTVAIPTATITPTPDHPQQAELDVSGRRMATVRGLFLLGEIERQFVSREELSARFREEFETDRDHIEQDAQLYRVLGVLEPDEDYFDLVLGLYTDIVVGMYDPDEAKLLVVAEGDELGPNDFLTYVHEYTHGLQQQHFDLKAIDDSLTDNADQAAAFGALREGDASVSEVLYMLNYFSDEERVAAAEAEAAIDVTAYSSAPYLIQRLIAFPYREGFNFVATLLQTANGWDLIDRAYIELPLSTEQILHPEKYLAIEAPLAVEPPDVSAALGEDWVEVRRDTLGEFMLEAYLEWLVVTERSTLATTGWGGDSYVLWRGPSGEGLLVLDIRWDTVDDAAEFFDVFLEFQVLRTGAEWRVLEDDSATSLKLTSLGQTVYLSMDEDETLVIYAPEGALVDDIVSTLKDTP